MFEDANVVIRKIYLAATELGLRDLLIDDRYRILREEIISPSTFAFDGNVGTFLDGRNGYWYGFVCRTNASSLKWIRISKEDYSFTEGTWSFDSASLFAAGQQNNYYNDVYGITCVRHCCIRNGCLYIMRSSYAGVYKINLSNPSEISYIELPKAGTTTGISSCYIQVVNDIIYGPNFMILANDTVRQLSGSLNKLYGYTPMFMYRNYLISWFTNCRYMYLYTPYLATINNLDTPVEKTPGKTMKITYTLTQVE